MRLAVRIAVGFVGLVAMAWAAPVGIGLIDVTSDTTTTEVWIEAGPPSPVVLAVGIFGIALVAFAVWPRLPKPRPPADTAPGKPDSSSATPS